MTTPEMAVVKASEVKQGDFLIDLDNVYVIEEPTADPVLTIQDGRHGFAVASGLVLITFHDQHGEENYLIVSADLPLTIERLV